MKGEIGTVIHGTLRNEDLIPAFVNEILYLDEEKKYKDLILECQKVDYDSEDAEYLSNEVLIDVLNEFAPDGCYFGSHIGDGSDFGFWPIEDFEENT